MNETDYRVFEGLRVATCLTFISGFLSAFTYITQGGRFAGVQSGNVVFLAYHLAQGQWYQAGQFLIPLVFFALGQGFTYLVRRACIKRQIAWHFTSSLIMLFLILAAFCLPSFFTMPLLAFVGSIQVETFRKVRDFQYANVMMTGNVKNAAYLGFKGWLEKDRDLQRKSVHVWMTIASFMLGVIVATRLVQHLDRQALLFVFLPMVYISVELWLEKWGKKKARNFS